MRRLLLAVWLFAAPLAGCAGGECADDPDCDDGEPCTEDRCRLSRCSHLVRPGCCHADADCPSGHYACEPASSTCIRVGAADGEACAEDEACLSASCLEEQASGAPGGICASPCSAEQPTCAAAGLSCVVTLSPFLGGGAYCLPRFDPAAGCREHYLPLVALDLATEQPVGICQPACSAESCGSGACNPASGLCGDPPGAGAVTGQPCAAHEDCQGLCMGFWPGGYCTSPCELGAAGCAGDGVCVDLGVQWCCLDGCAADTDCRQAEGYTCNPQVRVCVPPP